MLQRPLDRRLFVAFAAAATLALVAGESASGQADEPVVAAASDLRFALEEIAAVFKQDAGASVKLTFGSSGNFARQIRQGAPFQIYLSADESYVLGLARDGFTRDEGAPYAVGRIVLMVPNGSPLKADGSLADLSAALADGRVRRFAIANPDHAPYGKRAEEALRHKWLWDKIQPYLVLGENVSQAAQFATSANAQGGIIAYSLALAPTLSRLGSYALIPEDWHAPLRQRMVLLKDAGPVAERFYAYLRQPAARAIFRKYGFVLPGETS
ncbi:MAG: molybdate ABC transporter substrate-binding protein [Kiloniellales bacterium]